MTMVRRRSTTRTIRPKRKGQRTIRFKKGGLHRSVGVPQGKKIPASKRRAALKGRYGPKAKKQAQFARNVLTGGRRRRSR
jgi:hypothetical protein